MASTTVATAFVPCAIATCTIVNPGGPAGLPSGEDPSPLACGRAKVGL